jgi:hypothetical protein
MGLPIVFLPGVMGSRLRFPNSGRFWDPDSKFRMLEWVPVPLFNTPDKLARLIHRDEPALVIDDESPVLADDERGFGWEGVAGAFYVPFLRFLRQRFPDSPVRALGYDWRQDIALLGDDFTGRLGDLLAADRAGRAVLVTHSMGGLVVRWALKHSPGLEGQVAGVVHLFQPVLGAVVLYRRFFTGARLGLDGGLSDLPFLWILGDSPGHFAGNMCGLPGAMQLLPAPGYEFPAGTFWNSFDEPAGVDALYALAESPPGLVAGGLEEFVSDNLKARLAEVAAFHAGLGDYRHPQTWAAAGGGLDTDMTVAFADGQVQPGRQGEGDGTVPGPSAAALFPSAVDLDDPASGDSSVRQWRVPGVVHSDACLNGPLQEVVARVVGGLV